MSSSSSSTSTPLPIIRLEGNPEESFYRLGKHDRQDYKPLLDNVKAMLRSPLPLLDKALERMAHTFLPRLMKGKGNFAKYTRAYAQGLEENHKNILYSLMVPELISSTGRWITSLPNLGCSSYFIWDEALNCPVHGRVLDYPLLGTFEATERAVFYDFPGIPKILSYGSSGFPYPSITAMTEEGVTFALHQKNAEFFNNKGTPVFEIIFGLLSNCHDRKSAIDYLKNSCSITAWAFYMSFKNGEILAADLIGDELYFNLHEIGPNKEGVYLCNFFEDPERRRKKNFPCGYNLYNQMRFDSGLEKFEYLKTMGQKDSELLKLMGTPLGVSPSPDARNFKCDSSAMSSVQSTTLAPVAGRSLFIPGPGPKYYTGRYYSLTDLFDAQKCEEMTDNNLGSLKPPPQRYREGLTYLMSAQVAHNIGQTQEVYHQLQMGIDLLKGYPEAIVGQFFFLIYQYLYEKKRRMRMRLLREFKEIQNELPPLS